MSEGDDHHVSESAAEAIAERLADRLGAQLAGFEARIVDLERNRPDLGELRAAIDDLRAQVVDAMPDLRPLADRIDALGDALPEVVAQASPDVGPLHTALAEVVDAVAQQLDDARAAYSATRTAIERVVGPAGGGGVDVGPVVAAVEGLRTHYDETRPDLNALVGALTALRTQLLDTITDRLPEDGPDLSPVLAALVDLRTHVDGARPDLTPLHEEVASVRGDVAASRPDLGPVLARLDAVAIDLQDAIAASATELVPVGDAVDRLRRALEEQARTAGADAGALRESLADIANGVRHANDAFVPVGRTVDGLRDQMEGMRSDLSPVLEAVAGIRSQLESGPARTDELAASLRELADAVERVEAAQRSMARADAVDDLAVRLQSIESALNALRGSQDLREAEVRLGRRVDVGAEVIRARIDDQRALTDALAANVSQLNAALTKASEEPQQLRRDLDRIMAQLAERMGQAMLQLREHIGSSADEPLALRSSVEAGLDRISGRFQTDAGRILDAVATAQEDTDSRLRRIDAQVTELRRTVERVQRDAAMAGVAVEAPDEPS